MNIDKDVENFFKITHLDFRNFSFEDLVKGYGLGLSLAADKDEEKYYMKMDFLGPWVFTFSKILNQFFDSNQYNLVDVNLFCAERVLEVKAKTMEQYNDNDKVVTLSFMMAHNFIEQHIGEVNREYEMSVFYTMFENFYYIEKIMESVDKEFEDSQNGIGPKLS